VLIYDHSLLVQQLTECILALNNAILNAALMRKQKRCVAPSAAPHRPSSVARDFLARCGPPVKLAGYLHARRRGQGQQREAFQHCKARAHTELTLTCVWPAPRTPPINSGSMQQHDLQLSSALSTISTSLRTTDREREREIEIREGADKKTHTIIAISSSN